MNCLSAYADRPLAFLLRYVRRRAFAHAAILTAVVAAVACSVSTQYGVKFLVDDMWRPAPAIRTSGWPSPLLGLADRRRQSSVARGRLDRELRLRLRSQAICAATCFATSRAMRPTISHSAWLGHADRQHHRDLQRRLRGGESSSSGTCCRPAMATLGAIAFLASVRCRDGRRAHGRLRHRHGACCSSGRTRRPLHHGFANRAAQGRGRACRRDRQYAARPHLRRHPCGSTSRFDHTVGRELYRSPPQPAVPGTVAPAACGASPSPSPWRSSPGRSCSGSGATRPPAMLSSVCTLGFTVLHATRDLAVALVDVTQHLARLAEAIATLLQAARPARASQGSATCSRRGAPALCSRTSPSAIRAAGKVFERFGAFHRRGPTHRPRRDVGRRQVHARSRCSSVFMTSIKRSHPDRWPGRGADHAGEPSPQAISFVPQEISPVPPFHPGEYPLRPPRCER